MQTPPTKQLEPQGDTATPAALPQAPPPQQSLGQRAMGGMIWSIGQTVGSKVAAFLQQLILASFFLDEREFGRVAAAQVVISFMSLGQQLGVGEILVRRHRRFEKWVSIAFWMNLAGGMVGLAGVLVLAPFWHQAYRVVSYWRPAAEVPEIGGMLLVWGLTLPLDAMAAVAQARLRIDMKFRTLAMLGAGNIVALAISSVVLAWMGFGAYCLVLPLPVLSLAMVILSFRLSGTRIRGGPLVRRWGFVLRDSRYFLGISLFSIFLTQGDYLLTGIFFDPLVLGAYYFAFRLSTQTTQLIGTNLMSVLLPSFAKLDADGPRQVAAYRQTCATLALIGVPACLLQALVAEPLFHQLFGAKWDRALPLFQLLSIGMAFVLPSTSAVSLLMAQGRFRTYMQWTIGISLAFMAFVVAGEMTGSVVNVAWAVAAYYMLVGPLGTVMPVLRSNVGVAAFLGRVYLFPLIAGGISIAAGYGLGAAFPGSGHISLGLWRAAGVVAAYAILIAIVRPREAMDLLARGRQLVFRRGA